jgi:hypothetical protein
MKNIREPVTWRTCSSQTPHHRLFKASAFTMTMGWWQAGLAWALRNAGRLLLEMCQNAYQFTRTTV